MSNSLRPQGLQHSRLACPSPAPRAYSNSCPSSQWTYCRYIQLKLLDRKINQRKLQIKTQRNKEIENVRSYRRQRVKWSETCSVVSNPLQHHVLYSLWNSRGHNTGMGSLSLLQGIFPTQGSNTGHPHCRWILYQLSHKRSPRILEWVAYPFFSRSSQPRSQTGVSCIAGGFFTKWAIREAWRIQ